jgi:hypothetical protein
MTQPAQKVWAGMTIWQGLLALFLILLAIGYFGFALPAVVLGIFALLAAVAVLVGR